MTYLSEALFCTCKCQRVGISLELQNVEKLTQIGMELREKNQPYSGNQTSVSGYHNR
ncbi:MAG: hypothetical protein ACLTX6_01545 [Lachnospiraceae bacterium]